MKLGAMGSRGGFGTLGAGGKAGSSVVVPYEWDTATKPSTITLSNGNLTAAGGGTSPRPQVIGHAGATSGKKFFSIVSTGTPTVNQGVGVAASGFVPGTDGESGTKAANLAGDGNTYGNNSTLSTGIGAWVLNDVIDVAVDIGAKLLWVRKNGGDWNNSGTANPATGVGGSNISYLSGTFYPLDIPWPNTTHTANFGATAYTYAAPSGFSNWS